MCLGISLVRPGAKLQDIAVRVQNYVESHGFNMLRVSSATGHSIGLHHADGWHIPFYHDSRNEGRVLEEGMVITIEPFVSVRMFPADTRSVLGIRRGLDSLTIQRPPSQKTIR